MYGNFENVPPKLKYNILCEDGDSSTLFPYLKMKRSTPICIHQNFKWSYIGVNVYLKFYLNSAALHFHGMQICPHERNVKLVYKLILSKISDKFNLCENLFVVIG